MKLKDLHDQGLALISLLPNSKMPVEAGWTKGERDPWDKFKSKFKKGNNVGTRLGDVCAMTESHGLAVIDCDLKSDDPRHFDELNEALKTLGDFTHCPTVLSGRKNGSKHIYVLTPKGTPSKKLLASKELVKVHLPSVTPSKRDRANLTDEELSKGLRVRVAWEIDFCANGRQVVLPPSIHPDTGKRYEWQVPFDMPPMLIFTPPANEIAEPKIMTIAKAASKGEVLVENLGLEPEDVAAIKSGLNVEDRSSTILKLMYRLLCKGVSQEQILNVFTNKDYELGQVAYEHAKTSKRDVAANWLSRYTLAKAALAHSKRLSFDENVTIEGAAKMDPKEYSDLAAQIDEEQKASYVTYSKGDYAGRIRGDFKENVINALKELCPDTFSYNTMTNQVELLKPLSWTKAFVTGGMLTETMLLSISTYLERHFNFGPIGEGVLHRAVLTVANENTHDPLIKYLDSLSWDGVPRLDTWLAKYMHARGPAEYLAAVGRKFILAMVTRGYEPGTKFDYVMILGGHQGIAKSTAAKILAGAWFSDAPIKPDNKDALMQMQGTWLIELGELSILKKFEVEDLKRFISATSDRVRLPYAREVMEFKRRFCFIGTTNLDEFLKDPSGNRRYWPVFCGGPEGKEPLDIEGLAAVRDQLFAEAVSLYLFGNEKLYLDSELVLEHAKDVQSFAEEQDPWIFDISEALKKLKDEEEITPKTVFDTMFALTGRVPERGELVRIGQTMGRLCKDRTRVRKLVDGVKVTAYVKPLV